MKDLTVIQWMGEIDNGLRYRRQYGLEDSWRDLEAMFYNVFTDTKTPHPNIIFSTGDSLISQLTVPNPYIIVKALRMDCVQGAAVLERLDNMLLELLGIAEEVEMAALHAFLWGRGVLKIGYDSEFGFDPSLNVAEGMQATLTQYSP